MAYNDLNGYDTAYQSLLQQIQGLHSDSAGNRDILNTRLNAATDQFKSQFYNLVGRDPTNDEISQFLQQNAGQTIANSAGGLGRSEADPTSVTNAIQQYVGQNFHKAAQDYATQQLQQQQDQWQSLADQSRSMGNTAIDATQQSLLDYQQKLFQRLQPNLLTSLKSQGLLDTGGMNEAVAGVQGDLANNASNYIAQLKLQNEQNANQIALSGKAAPLQYQQGVTTGNPGFLDATGGNATNFNNATFMDNLNFQHQMALAHQQAQDQQGLQPSFLRTFGQSMAQSMGQAGGQGAMSGFNSALFGPKSAGAGAGSASMAGDFLPIG